ncbi:hypothetical protein EV210_101391 [Anaerospora hongkongensis]|uniref:Uncharacterized protein n=1 Tax=Anaerospora hongkongensis TaxID=244830 RepID=A0A4R1Q2K5_9FIRM|nr:CBO0543 family protein [Anaerospora hongkongensis]TCL40190.1 hypothetical protein EV210_101391 [Anaerospora hongkongensis]
MFLEEIILYSVTIGFPFLFWKFIPINKRRHAQVAFLSKQFLTWISGLVVASLGLIEYPVRFFPAVNRASFTFEFLAYPVICAFFNVYYPENKSKLVKIAYFLSCSSALTAIELILERYTQLIKYIYWSGYLTWVTLLLTLYISRMYYRWFFKI